MVESECVFCKIIRGQIPAAILLQTDTVVIIKDIAPKAPIHYLAIPTTHLVDLCDKQASTVMAHMVDSIHTLIAQKLLPNSFRTIVNTGFQSGQRVFHLHMHILAGTVMADF